MPSRTILLSFQAGDFLARKPGFCHIVNVNDFAPYGTLTGPIREDLRQSGRKRAELSRFPRFRELKQNYVFVER
jgi:hypothetical protein